MDLPHAGPCHAPEGPPFPSMVQAWTYKKLGFPLPYLVVGRWGITPFPCRTALKFIVGAPISPPSPVPLSGEVLFAACIAKHACRHALLSCMCYTHVLHPSCYIQV